MSAAPFSHRSPCAPVCALLDVPALERLLVRAGYRRIESSRLGERAAGISVWEGRNLFVLLMSERLVVGPIGAQHWRVRTTLDRLEPDLLRFIRADAPGLRPPSDDVPDSGAWPTR